MAVLHNEIADNQHQADDLQCGFKLLHGQYQIESALSDGGFGITYLARDSLDRRVVIKECFAAGICDRIGGMVAPADPSYDKQYKTVLRHFLREAQWLAKSVHPGIVGIHQVFRENNTAYIAMEFIEGVDLVTLYEDHPDRITSDLLQDILEQALDTLAFLHGQGILHRDISPDNFLLDRGGAVTLIDFGSASGDQTDKDIGVDPMLSVKDGYSAHELYRADMPHRPACDLYSLGATLYYLITGSPPPNCQHRLEALSAGKVDPCQPLSGHAANVTPRFLESIDKALSVMPGVRYQSATEWLDELQADLQAPRPVTRTVTRRLTYMKSAEPAKINADLENMLASLVENTNNGLITGLPKSVDQSTAEPTQIRIEPPAAPKQLVDIFGDPIGDVDTWLLEQDAQSRRKKPQNRPTPSGSGPQSAPPKSSGGFFSRSIAFRLCQLFGATASHDKTQPADKS